MGHTPFQIWEVYRKRESVHPALQESSAGTQSHARLAPSNIQKQCTDLDKHTARPMHTLCIQTYLFILFIYALFNSKFPENKISF